jgi:hypothetical protein
MEHFMKRFLISILFILSSLPVHAEISKFNSMIKFEEQCSGSLVKFENQPMNQNAYILTNAHCLKFKPEVKPLLQGHGSFLKNIDYEAENGVIIYGSKDKEYQVKIKKIVFATMSNTDVALLSLQKSYEELEKEFEVKPLLLSPHKSEADTKFDLISGYWLKGYRCSIDKFILEYRESLSDLSVIPLKLTREAIKYTKREECDETPGGTSGSPLVRSGTREVIGLHGTSNVFNELRACEFFDGCEVTENSEIILNKPACSKLNGCEVTKDGLKTLDHGARYGFQTYFFYSCLTGDYQIDLEMSGCKLKE